MGHAIELAALALFGWCWIDQRGRGARSELGIAVLYGWLLETLDLWVFGTYHYAPVTWWWLGRVPLYIPLLWATILHSSMALSDRAGLPRWARPFLDGLLAVLIDLAVDAIAIRVGLWRWAIPLDQGWFGVPAGNLCAWMWVAAWYGGLTRLVRDRIAQRSEPAWHRWLVPGAAYAGLFASLLAVGAAGRWLGLEGNTERLWLFAAHAAGFLAVVLAAGRAPRARPAAAQVPWSLAWNRWLMHGAFWIVVWAGGIWRESALLAAVSSASLVVEWQAQRWCASWAARAA